MSITNGTSGGFGFNRCVSLPHPPASNDGMTLVEITVSTGSPTFSEDEFAKFQQNREELEAPINWEEVKKKHEALGLLLRNCPVATNEEMEWQDEIRRSMEQWRI